MRPVTTAAEPSNRPLSRDAAGGEPCSRTHAGFALAESIVVTGLCALLVLSAAPLFPEVLDRYALYGATRGTYADLQWSRMAAVAENTRYRARITTDGSLQLNRYNRAQAAWEAVRREKSWDRTTTIAVTASADIVFAPNGSAPSAGKLVLTSPRGAQRKITVGAGGSVRIE